MIDKFKAITFFPDGSIYDTDDFDINDLADNHNQEILQKIDFDSLRKKSIIQSPIGELEFVWTGCKNYGVSTILKGGVTVNAGVYLTGKNSTEEDELLRYFINQWRSFDLVKDISLTPNPFEEVFTITDRPLMCSVNWSTLSLKEYNMIANYDLEIASYYFRLLRDYWGHYPFR